MRQTCPNCGERLTKQTVKPRHTPRVKPCPHCSQPFYVRFVQQRYCSKKCKVNAWLFRHGTVRQCETCGRMFRALPTSAGRFCSMACTNKARRGGGWYLQPARPGVF